LVIQRSVAYAVGMIVIVLAFAPAVSAYNWWCYTSESFWVYPEGGFLQSDFNYYGTENASDPLRPVFGYNYNTLAGSDLGYVYDGLPQDDWPAGVELTEAYADYPNVLVQNSMYSRSSMYCWDLQDTDTEGYGSHVMRMALDLPPGLSGYYQLSYFATINIFEYLNPASAFSEIKWTPSENLTIRLGLAMPASSPYDIQYNWSDPAEVEDNYGANYIVADSFGYDLTANQTNFLQGFRPFSAAELEDVQLAIDCYIHEDFWGLATEYDDGYIRAYVAAAGVLVTPVPYSEPVASTAAFILRPDSDLNWTQSWTGVPNATDLHENINDSAALGDGDDSYIRALWDEYAVHWSGLSDPPETASDDYRYEVTLWVMTRETVDNFNDELRTAVVLPGFGMTPWISTAVLTDPGASYWNFTYPQLEVPETLNESTNWTLDELTDAMLQFTLTGSDPYGEIRITQVALYCVPCEYVAPPPEFDFDGVAGFLVNGGLSLIFAFIGVALMVVAPAVGVIRAKSGEGGIMGFMICVFLIALGTGLLWVGLAGHW